MMVETPSQPAPYTGARTEADDTWSAVRRYRNAKESVPAVRAFVRQQLAGYPLDYVNDVVTVASELATNAANHTRGPSFVVLLRRHHSGCWSVNVEDRGPRSQLPVFPRASVERTDAAVPDLDALATCGRGLGIVAALCPEHWARPMPCVDSWHVGGMVAWTGGDDAA